MRRLCLVLCVAGLLFINGSSYAALNYLWSSLPGRGYSEPLADWFETSDRRHQIVRKEGMYYHAYGANNRCDYISTMNTLTKLQNIISVYSIDGDDYTNLITAMNEYDTDGDGVSDGTELGAGYDLYDENQKPDVWNLDSDGDGIINALESRCGTDPYSASSTPTDTDGDGWPDLVDYYPNDASIYGHLGDATDYEALIASDPDGDLDGDGIINSEDQDVDGDGASNWQEIYSGSSALNANEKPYDSDGDGFSDAMEMSLGYGAYDPDSHPYGSGDSYSSWSWDDVTGMMADADGDGVLNYLEAYYGSNPNDATSTPTDTDGDGWPDAAERQYGSGLNDPSSHPPNGTVDYGDGVVAPAWSPSSSYNPSGGHYNGGGASNDDEPEVIPPEEPEDEEVEEDDSNTDLTQEDVAEAVQAAIQATGGSITAAVKSGVWQANQDIDKEVTQGIYNAQDAIETAMGNALYWAAQDGLLGGDGGGTNASTIASGIRQAAGSGPGEVSMGYETGGVESTLAGIGASTGMDGVLDDLRPEAQTDFELEIQLPAEFAGVRIADDDAMTFSLSVLPDTSTPWGAALNGLRLLLRTLTAVMFLWLFTRSLKRSMFEAA